MAILLDILIIAVIIICVVIGVKKGFVEAIISLLGFTLAIVLAWSFAETLGETIDENVIRPWAVRAIIKDSEKEGLTPDSSLDEVSADDLTLNEKILALFKNDTDEVENDYAKASEKEDKGTIGQFLDNLLEKQSITLLASKTIAVVIIFVVVSLVLWVVKLLLKAVFRLPVLRQCDQLLGAVVGLANAAIIILICCTAISFLGILSKTDDTGLTYQERVVDKTVIFKYIYENNPINYIFEKE